MSLLDTVRAERAKYGTPLGNENAWRTINAVCLQHAAEGWGLTDKPTGTNYQGYSIDVIINRFTGEAVDCLGDAEGEGRPTWNVIDPALAPTVNRWRQPVGAAPIPTPSPVPTPTDLEGRVEVLEQTLKGLIATLRSV